MSVRSHFGVIASGIQSVFDPSSVSGLKIWLDASDLSTITKDGSDRVSQWNDKSGGARHLTQATAGDQPLWLSADQNGRDVIDFTSNRFMDDSWSAESVPNTIFIAAELPQTGTGGRTNLISGYSSNAQSVFGDDPENTYKYAAGSAQGGTKTGIEGTWQDVYALYGGAYDFEINGDSISSANCGTDDWTGMTVGASSVDSQFGDMKVGEIVGYNASITGDDKTAILNYLKTKWGIS